MKYFVVSDLHSFATEAKYVLKKAGFNKTNKNHTLIVCGDVFDRGDETVELYKYLKSIPKKRCILIKGNHESLYFDLLERNYPGKHDFHNGTVKTFCNIANMDEHYFPYWVEHTDWLTIRETVKNHEITKWLHSSQWVDYFELDRFIFVHSFIPTPKSFDEESLLEIPFVNWREMADQDDWEHARWGNPVNLYKAGYFDYEKQLNKTLVVGHWHVWDFHAKLGGQDSNTMNRDIYYSNNLVALDGGITREWYGELIPHPNVLVIDDADFKICYDQYGFKLTNMEALNSDK